MRTELFYGSDENFGAACREAEKFLAGWQADYPQHQVVSVQLTAYATTETGGDWPVVYHNVILAATYIEVSPLPVKTCADFERPAADDGLALLVKLAKEVDRCASNNVADGFGSAAAELVEAVLSYAEGGLRTRPMPAELVADDQDELDAINEARNELMDLYDRAGE